MSIDLIAGRICFLKLVKSWSFCFIRSMQSKRWMCQPRLLDWSLDTPAVAFRRRIPIRRASATRGLLQGVDIMPQCGMCRTPHKSSGSYWKMCSRCSTPVENLATKSPWTYKPLPWRSLALDAPLPCCSTVPSLGFVKVGRGLGCFMSEGQTSGLGTDPCLGWKLFWDSYTPCILSFQIVYMRLWKEQGSLMLNIYVWKILVWSNLWFVFVIFFKWKIWWNGWWNLVIFHLGWFTKKSTHKSRKNSVFPTLYERFWDLWGPFLCDQPKWKISN